MSKVLSNAAWVQTALSQLLASPHIHFQTPAVHGIRLGPGPIDLFSTRFNNDFSNDVKAIVAGEAVNRDQLKERLLGLQQHYSPENGKFEIPEVDHNHAPGEVHVKLTDEAKDIGRYEVSVDANVVEEGGRRMMSFIKLEGNPRLFFKASDHKDEL